MSVMVLYDPQSSIGRQIRTDIESLPLSVAVPYFESLTSLFIALGSSMTQYKVVVLQIRQRGELDDILKCMDMFKDKRLILVLPDDAPETISKANRLHPRIILFAEDTGKYIKEILEKMLALSKDRRNTQRLT